MHKISWRRVLILTAILAPLILAPLLFVVWNLAPTSEPATGLLAELHAKYGTEHFSQNNEELIIRDFFNDRRNGVFLDVGAYDFQRLSNTFFLEKNLGWTGIAIDAQKEFAEGYAKFRPGTQFFAFYVSDASDETVKFFVPPNRKNIGSGHEEVAQHESAYDTLEVQTITLNDLLSKLEVKKIDFLNMDIELHEPAALAGFDIEKYNPDLVCIEFHEAVRSQITAYMDRHGYVPIEKYFEVDSRNRYYRPRNYSFPDGPAPK